MRKDAPKVAIFRTQIVRKDQIILNDLSIEIDAGSWTEIIGRSGAGKSDLFSSLSLREKPKLGQVVFGGMNLEKMNERAISEARFSIGSCAQTPIFLENETIRDNLLLPLLIRGFSENEANEEIVKITDAFAMTNNISSKLRSLDYDDRLLVGIARAFVGSPKLVLLDGLLSALSLSRQHIVLRHLRLENMGGTTIVLFNRSRTMLPSPSDRHQGANKKTTSTTIENDAIFKLDRKGVTKVESLPKRTNEASILRTMSAA